MKFSSSFLFVVVFLATVGGAYAFNETFTTNTTWVVPSGVTYISVEVIGGGGGGSWVNDNANVVKPGGGGGGYVQKNFSVTPGELFTITVGHGGNRNTGIVPYSYNGTESRFNGSGVTLVAGGGRAGSFYNTSGGSGGTASGGDINSVGGQGSAGAAAASTGGAGGAAGGRTGNGATASGNTGGTGVFPSGSGANSTAGDSSGNTGLNYGGGGSSGRCDSSCLNQNGGAGGNGTVLITYTTPPALLITASDLFNNASITTFNATVTGTGEFISLLDKSGNGNTLTNNGATWNSTSNSYNFDGTNDYLQTTNIDTRNIRTASFWVFYNGSTPTSNQGVLGSNNARQSFTMTTAGNFQIEFTNFDNNLTRRAVVPLTGLSTGINHVIAIQTTDTSIDVYFNGVNQSKSTFTIGTAVSQTSYNIGRSSTTAYYNGSISDVRVWNRSLSAAEVATVYANGSVSDGLVALYDFSGYGTTNYSTTNGTIITGYTANTTTPANITVNANNYFPATYTNYQINSLDADLYQSLVSFNAEEVVSEANITSFTVCASGGNCNTSTNPTLYLTGGAHNITWNKTGWYSKTFEINATPLTSSSYTIEGVHQYKINLTAKSISNGTFDNTFSATIVSGDYAYNTSASTTNGSIIIPWTSDNNINLTIVNASFLATTSTLWSTSNYTAPSVVNITIEAYTTNSLFITFRDEETGALINNATITAYFTGTVTSYNYTTTTGYLNATLINPQTYTITYGGSPYSNREYIVTLTNQTAQALTLWLLNNETGTYIRFTVLDQTYLTLVNATIDAQKKNLSGTNYYTVAECSTDNNGECLLFLDTLTTTYRFLTSYQDVTRISSDTILSRDTYTIVLNLGSSTLDNVLGRSNLQASLNYTPVGTFTYTFNNPDNTEYTGELIIQRRYGGVLTTINSSTATGGSFTIQITGVNVTLGDEILASGYITVDGEQVLTHQISVIDNEQGDALGGGLLFLFIGIMFTIVFIFAWNPVAPLVGFAVFIIIASRIGIVAIGMPAVIAILVVLGVAIYRMRSV